MADVVGRAQRAAGEVPGAVTLEGLDDAEAECLGQLEVTDVLEQHGAREDQGRGVGLALAGDVVGAAVDGLEQGDVVADVGAGRHAQATDHAGAQVREDVTEHVLGHDDAELLRTHHQLHGHGIDQQVVGLDAVVLRGHGLEGVRVDTTPHLVDVALGHQGDAADAGLTCVVECAQGQALHGLFGETRHQAHLALALGTHGLLGAGVEPLGVLPVQDQADVRARAGQADRDGRAHARVQVQLLAQTDVDALEPATTGGVGRALDRQADRADQLESLLGELVVGLGLAVQARLGLDPVDLAAGHVVQHLARGSHDLRSDAISVDVHDLQSVHVVLLCPMRGDGGYNKRSRSCLETNTPALCWGVL